MILNWPLIIKTDPILCNLSLFRSPKCNCKLLTFVVWKYLMLVTKKSNLNLGMTKESTFNSHRAGSRWWNLKFVNFYIGHSISDLVHQLLYSQQIEFSTTNHWIGRRPFVRKIHGLNAVLNLYTMNSDLNWSFFLNWIPCHLNWYCSLSSQNILKYWKW